MQTYRQRVNECRASHPVVFYGMPEHLAPVIGLSEELNTTIEWHRNSLRERTVKKRQLNTKISDCKRAISYIDRNYRLGVLNYAKFMEKKIEQNKLIDGYKLEIEKI